MYEKYNADGLLITWLHLWKKPHVRLDHRDSLQEPRFLAMGAQSTDYQSI